MVKRVQQWATRMEESEFQRREGLFPGMPPTFTEKFMTGWGWGAPSLLETHRGCSDRPAE